MILAATNESIELVTSSTSAVHVVASWVDITTSAFTADSSEAVISSATDTTIVAAPGSSTQRQVKRLTIRNAGAAANTVTVQKDVAGTEYEITPDVTLAAGDKGVRAIASVTLGTTYGGGAISIIAFRRIAFVPVPVINTGQAAMFASNPGVRLYDGSCLHFWQLPTATTATTVQGVATFAER